VGVDFGGPVQFNRIAGNGVGVAARNGQLIAHNLVYRNAVAVSVRHRSGVRIVQNTFYTPAGDHVRVEDGSSDVEVRNNVFWTEDGYDLYVADDSRQGFFSDYNLLHASGGGKPVHWVKDFTALLDWQADVGRFDLNSIGTTVVNPTASQPRFLDRARDDYRTFGPAARQRWSSPGLDAGDPLADLALPAGTPNLLTNPGFES